MQVQTPVEEYFDKQSSIFISHPLYSGVLSFTVRSSNGSNMFVSENTSAWINIDESGLTFPKKLVISLPEKITDYVLGYSNSGATRVGRPATVSYLAGLTNGDGLMFSSQGDSLGKERVGLSVSERVHRHMRYRYPNGLDTYLGSYNIEGWVRKLSGGPQVRFGQNGNFVEIIPLKWIPDIQLPRVLYGFYFLLCKRRSRGLLHLFEVDG